MKKTANNQVAQLAVLREIVPLLTQANAAGIKAGLVHDAIQAVCDDQQSGLSEQLAYLVGYAAERGEIHALEAEAKIEAVLEIIKAAGVATDLDAEESS